MVVNKQNEALPQEQLNPPSAGEAAALGNEFVPEITVFTCIYCAYMSADTAGALRAQYPAGIKIVKLPCTGKVDARYLLEAFEQGADGVCVVGCPIGNCHHVNGNKRAQARVAYTQKLLDQIGLGSERLEMYFVTGGMGVTYATAIREMSERIKELGPNPLRKSMG
ncbi:MAG: hydrogenase iron-sulfur subunit [Chloroflexi bacterium]|nr:hydrogenase iron-sulfur subunit [Chloroflexota bacterium]